MVTSELTAFLPNVSCILVLSNWAMVAFSPCGKIMTPLRESPFDLGSMSHILFGVDAISSQEPMLNISTHLGEDAVVKLLMIFRANVTFFD